MFIESSYENVQENMSAFSCCEHCSMFTVTVTLKALRAVSMCYKWPRNYCYVPTSILGRLNICAPTGCHFTDVIKACIQLDIVFVVLDGKGSSLVV
jgi:hypothetical protein